MKLIDNITDDSKQRFVIIGERGEVINFYLYYLPTQQCWAFDIKYANFEANGLVLTVSLNVLQNYCNIIPFGIACISDDNLDPYYLDDFKNGRCNLLLLNTNEVNAFRPGK